MKEARQAAFLAAYAETGYVRKACEAAGVSKSSHYEWLSSDPEYAQRFAEAKQAATADFEDEARRRAVDGLRIYKFNNKTGEPLQHPDICECYHDRREWHLDGGKGRCVAPGCECEGVVGQPYFEHAYSDRLLEVKLRALVEEYRDRHEIHFTGDVRQLIARMDLWPDEYIARVNAGEPVQLVVASMGQEVIRGILPGSIEEAEFVELDDPEQAA